MNPVITGSDHPQGIRHTIRTDQSNQAERKSAQERGFFCDISSQTGIPNWRLVNVSVDCSLVVPFLVFKFCPFL